MRVKKKIKLFREIDYRLNERWFRIGQSSSTYLKIENHGEKGVAFLLETCEMVFVDLDTKCEVLSGDIFIQNDLKKFSSLKVGTYFHRWNCEKLIFMKYWDRNKEVFGFDDIMNAVCVKDEKVSGRESAVGAFINIPYMEEVVVVKGEFLLKVN